MDAVRLSGPAAASDASPSRSTTALDLRLLTIFGAVGLKQPRPVTSSPAAGFADAVELSKDVWRSRGNVVSMSSDAASSESPSWGGRGGVAGGPRRTALRRFVKRPSTEKPAYFCSFR